MFKEITETIRAMQPSRRQLRWFGVVLAALPAVAIFSAESYALKTAGGGAGLIILVLALFFPAAIKPLWLGLMAVTIPIGWVISRLILAAFFYIIITPASLLSALAGKDPLNLKRKNESTYWEAVEENKNPDSMGL